jgi:hypothetical protein
MSNSETEPPRCEERQEIKETPKRLLLFFFEIWRPLPLGG